MTSAMLQTSAATTLSEAAPRNRARSARSPRTRRTCPAGRHPERQVREEAEERRAGEDREPNPRPARSSHGSSSARAGPTPNPIPAIAIDMPGRELDASGEADRRLLATHSSALSRSRRAMTSRSIANSSGVIRPDLEGRPASQIVQRVAVRGHEKGVTVAVTAEKSPMPRTIRTVAARRPSGVTGKRRRSRRWSWW